MSPVYDYDALESAPDNVNKQPGIYHAEIAKCELKQSKAGNWMFNLQLVDLDDGRILCFDRLMLPPPPGQPPMDPFPLSMTKGKLKALGLPLNRVLDESEFKGLRVWVNVAWGKPDEKGNSYLQPNGSRNSSKFGYWPDGEHPLADPSQAATLVTAPKEPARSGRASWPAGVTREQDLPPDHPDYCAF